MSNNVPTPLTLDEAVANMRDPRWGTPSNRWRFMPAIGSKSRHYAIPKRQSLSARSPTMEGDGTMRTSKFTPEQMVNILRMGDNGVPVVELCRQHGISEQTYYRWRKRFGDLGTAEVRELRQLREENRKLKQVAADLMLDKQILKEALAKKC